MSATNSTGRANHSLLTTSPSRGCKRRLFPAIHAQQVPRGIPEIRFPPQQRLIHRIRLERQARGLELCHHASAGSLATFGCVFFLGPALLSGGLASIGPAGGGAATQEFSI